MKNSIAEEDINRWLDSLYDSKDKELFVKNIKEKTFSKDESNLLKMKNIKEIEKKLKNAEKQNTNIKKEAKNEIEK